MLDPYSSVAEEADHILTGSLHVFSPRAYDTFVDEVTLSGEPGIARLDL